ncbi:MAG: exo-alpha-sialidase [Candidatus Omnitrophica bacterium]|nr:exo-alpha-sialidase [Candidatus Omnitrophota bacterium]
MKTFIFLFTFLLWISPGHCLETPGPEELLVINPSSEFPRHSEGDVIQLKNGSLCLVYTRFFGGAHDDSAAEIVAMISSDGGDTWSEPRVLVEREGDKNVMSVSLLRLEDGEILLFYLVKNGWCDLKMYVRRSSDELQTVGEKTLVTVADGYHVVNNDRVVQLSSGRLVVPAALHRCIGDTREGWSNSAILRVFYSDDQGKSWRVDQSDPKAEPDKEVVLQEPGIVELKDGRLMMYIRTNGGTQYVRFSSDQGESWTKYEPGNLASPLSPATIERIPWSGDLVAVWNDHSGWHNYPPGKRTPHCLAVSKDEGKTWSKSRVLEGNPDGWYCYTSMTFADDRLILSYCAGDKEVGGLNRLKVLALPREWLEME